MLSSLLVGMMLQVTDATAPMRVPPGAAGLNTVSNTRVVSDDADEIVVEGYRLRPDIETKVVPPAGSGTIGVRQGFEWSTVLARCAARNKLNGLSWLRGTVDGAFQTTKQAVAQDRLRRIYTTCSENPEWIARNTRPPNIARSSSFATLDGGVADGQVAGDNSNVSDVAPLGHNIYDRGAFTIEALKRFAPDLRLTRADTLDPAVQARFNVRETARNRFRLPADYRYFEVAVCMVREEPRLSVMLALSDGPARFGDVQAALIDRARVCVGGVPKVTVDPTEFRVYIADAVYRWAVAARDVDSLIPSS